MTIFPFGETVTFHVRTLLETKDADGNDRYGEVDKPVEGCGFAPAGSVELVQGRDTVTDQPSVFVPRGNIPAGVDLGAADAATVRGVRYEVDGTPEDFRSPFTGWAPPLVVKLKGVSG